MATRMKLPDPIKAKAFFEDKMAFTTGPIEVDHFKKLGDSFNIIDVRAREDYEDGHVPGAVNLPEAEWNSFKGLSRDKLNVLYCYSEVCHLAAKAAVKFATGGYPVMEMDGGFAAWKDHDLEVESQPELQKKRSA
jgi:rhodanese-related sulfurtransferase